MSNDNIKNLNEILGEIERRRNEAKLDLYQPYKKQLDFHALGRDKRERLLFAGNQQGKSYCGAMETAMHLTGKYPDWWTGRRWSRPVKMWAGGMTGLATRDNPQRLLLGEPWPQGIGTGTIPKEDIVDYSMARGVSDAVDSVIIKHVSGGASQLNFKSYEQGRTKWQGSTIDAIWFDEEPPFDIYTEGLARITATKGMTFTTFTPLLGMSETVRRFLDEPTEDRATVTMTIIDAEHIAPEDRQRIIDGYPDFERDARINGVPMLGSGRIFQIAEDKLRCDPFEIPKYWGRIAGLDIGVEHPTAVVWLAHNRDDDAVYLTDIYAASDKPVFEHAHEIQKRLRCPVAWPHDANSRDKGSGISIAAQYRRHGVNMLPGHARWDDGSTSVEAGIEDMRERMITSRFKVFSHLEDWFSEYRLYHRKNGLIVKEKDDLLSATRYAVMSLRFAKTAQDLDRRRHDHQRQRQTVAKGIDYNLFGYDR